MAELDELLFQPTFEKPKAGDARGPEARDDAAAIKTYRYLRLGMVMVVVALVASVFIQWRNAGCWQGSISAYYYSPARAIFVSGMVAIGVSLIVIKGSTVVEDMLLNVAGVLAPIVAFVPTTFEQQCVRDHALVPGQGGKLADDIIRLDVQNNVEAYLIAGVVALGVAVVVFVIDQLRGNDDVATGFVKFRILAFAFSGLALGLGAWLLATDKILELHGTAAVLMFAALAVASVWNGAWLFWINKRAAKPTSTHWKALAALYVAVGFAMGLAGCIITFVVPNPWDHRLLVLEMTEIALFAAMWVVQSVERWGKILQAPA